MVRIVKEREIRRKEIMETANRLFMANGYEATSVDQIVQASLVAKGTFYYYFKSKEDILIAIIEETMSSFVDLVNEKINNPYISSVDKLNYVFNMIFFNRNEPEISKYVEDRKDNKVHQTLDEIFFNKFYPIFLSIIKQGIKEQKFNIKYPEETTEILIIGIRGFIHNHQPKFNNQIYAFTKLKAVEELFNLLLGVKFDFFKTI